MSTGASLRAQTFPQDLIAVTFTGNAVTVHSRTGLGQILGTTGHTGHNSMARHGNALYTVEQVGTGPSAQRFLDVVDDVTGVATRTVAIARDLRGLAPGNSTTLLAIAENGNNDELVRVSVATGAIAVIGSTGFGAVQGLTVRNGQVFAWDLVFGLIRIDPATGAGTDVDPAVGTNGAGIQFLATMSDGRVIGGQNSIFELDLATGVPTLRGSGAYNDLRGAEERFGVVYTFGVGCGATMNLPQGQPQGGSTIVTSSTGHGSGAPGMLFVGFSDNAYLGAPLPLRLDAFLGTIDCFAYAGPDVSVAASANQFGFLGVPIAVPAGAQGLVFHVQHLSLSALAPGGLVFSNAATVRTRL